MEELNKQGWNISAEGHNLITENGNIKDYKTLYTNALNTDIKDFGESVLSASIKKNTIDKIVLQIQKIRNVAAPKAKEESQFAPRMLKFILTDGHTNCQAIELNNIASLSRLNTPPGTKILIDNAKVSSGCILLTSNNCKVLGGRVLALYDKWEVVKNMSNHVRTLGGTDGAPLWVNFGEKIVGSIPNEPFKSLVNKPTTEDVDEFSLQRQDAIAAVASTGAVKKVFGGGSKAQPQAQQQDYGASLNNKRNFKERPQQNNYRTKREPREKIVDKPQKPAEKVSLFAFLENKLVNEDNKQTKFVQENSFKAENNYIKQHKFKESRSYDKFQPQVGNFGKNNKDPVESIVNNFNRVSINPQYASRTAKQQFNLGDTDINSSSGGWKWKVGDLCMAKYWEDGKYYNATIKNLSDSTCVVQFNGYGNVEEVLKLDCIPISDFGQENSTQSSNFHNQQYKGSGGYRNNKRQYSNNYRTFNNKAS